MVMSVYRGSMGDTSHGQRLESILVLAGRPSIPTAQPQGETGQELYYFSWGWGKPSH